MEGIGGGDKHDLGKIVIHINVMIIEGMVLLRIKHFQQRGRWVAAEIHAHFIHFIQQKHRIVGAGLFQALHNFPRQGADIGSAMPADFGLIPHAAQRQPHKLSARCPGN